MKNPGQNPGVAGAVDWLAAIWTWFALRVSGTK